MSRTFKGKLGRHARNSARKSLARSMYGSRHEMRRRKAMGWN